MPSKSILVGSGEKEEEEEEGEWVEDGRGGDEGWC